MPAATESIAYEVATSGDGAPIREREWLLTNGLGGFASGTTAGINTRRYHGLLVAATLPPVGRVMTLSRFVERLTIDGRPLDFSAGVFGSQVVGDAAKYLRRFRLAGEVARWEFDVEGTTVEKELLVCWQANAVGVRYRVRRGPGPGTIALHLLPFVALRDFHGLRRRDDQPAPAVVATESRGVTVGAGELAVRMESDTGRFVPRPDWWFNHTYAEETARGLDDTEDLFTPGAFEVDCAAYGETVVTLWSHAGAGAGETGFDWDRELERRRREIVVPALPTPTQQKLARAAADFIVKRRRPDGKLGTTVIAGYPWFADWGRDTFIALPGLFLATGRFEEAGQVLATFADHVSAGMIPNRFNDYTNEPEYNTVDASLWFVHAAHEYARVAKDLTLFERVLRPACGRVIEGYTRGTRYNIRVDPADGLVTAGDATTQLTWMDAKRDGVVFTPRHGKAVEVNALWFNALMLLGETARAEQVRRSFVEAFWVGEGRSLVDVVNAHGPDESIRPNQIFSVSLPHSPLDRRQQQSVVEVVRQSLLTPYGLRTLAPGDARYKSHFAGAIFERDRAYHNGTVWPWLLGAFLAAYLKVNHRAPAAVAQAREWLRPLVESLSNDGCLGSISEVFDAEPPYRPGGCFAQAWSVAEVLRLTVELEV